VVPERHLGLLTAPEADPEIQRRLADMVERQLDLDQLLAIARSSAELPHLVPPPQAAVVPQVRIGLARDEAFCFYYPDNLALLEAAGAVLVPFSPIRDAALSDRLDGLYFGGGYPELHAAELAGNRSLREGVRRFAADGKPVYGECGGLMYLCEELVDRSGAAHRMAGCVPARCRMEAQLQAIGYREVTLLQDSLLGATGARLRGHEFHHSRLVDDVPATSRAFEVRERSLGFASGNVLASYVHLHFGSYPAAADSLVRKCLAAR
jgi:cobyrinic acid a,c-diamide synthase